MNHGKNLYQAIVCQALLDVEYLATRAKKDMKKYNYVWMDNYTEMREIGYSIETEWFKTICLLADVPIEKVRTAMIKMKLKLDYENIVFASKFGRKAYTRAKGLEL